MMSQAGVTNPLEYPILLDQLEKRVVVCKVKWQPTWDNCSVQAVKEDDGVIEKIKNLFPKDHVEELLQI